MGVKVQRPRCFFDIAINNVPGKKMGKKKKSIRYCS